MRLLDSKLKFFSMFQYLKCRVADELTGKKSAPTLLCTIIMLAAYGSFVSAEFI